MKIEKASLSDALGIRDLISIYAKEEKMLPRSLSSVYENIREYSVAKEGNDILGCCGLHVYWLDMAEVRSLAIHPRYVKRGLGSRLVRASLREAKKMGIKKLFTLTLAPKFFNKLGFRKIDANTLPMKVWGDCVNCSKFMDCDETAMQVEL